MRRPRPRWPRAAAWAQSYAKLCRLPRESRSSATPLLNVEKPFPKNAPGALTATNCSTAFRIVYGRPGSNASLIVRGPKSSTHTAGPAADSLSAANMSSSPVVSARACAVISATSLGEKQRRTEGKRSGRQ
eukprot:2698437-Prymnesium_polylepis.1